MTTGAASANVLLKSALKYVEVLHWSVIPVHGKLPLTEHGALDASLDPAQIREWWKQWPNANIALATGINFWVLDQDAKTGGNYSLEDLEEKHGRLPDTVQQMTGGGGRQWFWNQAKFEIRNSQGAIAPGLDVRGTHGYVVAPPSTHPETHKQYIWDGAAELKDQKILDAPQWLLDLARPAEKRQGPFEVPPKIPHGVQHGVLVGFSGKLRNLGLEPEEIFPCVWEINKRRCEKPGSEANIRKMAESMRKYAPGKFHVGRDQPAEPPQVLNFAELHEKETPLEKMIFDTFPIPIEGLTLIVGAPKAGKSILATQVAASVATGTSLFDCYGVQQQGPVLIVERDDPRGPLALKSQLMKLAPDPQTPIYSTGESPEGFGPAMAEWLEGQITKLELKLVVLDSYTAIRASRSGNPDIVKLERAELELLDSLAKRLGCAIVLIHHGSKSAADLDWTMSASGSFAMFAGTETLCHISRFSDMDGAPERLVRMRGRHSGDLHLALRYIKSALSYEHIVEGPAAPLFPLLHQIKTEFGNQPFTAKALYQATGHSPATGYRLITKLRHAQAIVRHDASGTEKGAAEYLLAIKI